MVGPCPATPAGSKRPVGADVELISAGAADGGPIGGEVGQPHGAGSENAGAVGEAIGREVQGGTVGRADAVDGIGPVVDRLAGGQAGQGHGERARTAAGMRHLGVGGRRCTGCIPNDAALRHRLPPLGRHVAGGVGLRGIRRRARRRRGRADRRQRPRRRVGRHARRVVVVVDAVELVVINRALRPPRVVVARAVAIIDDQIATDGAAARRVGRALRRRGERTVRAAHHHHVVADRVLGPRKVDLGRAGHRRRLAARIPDRADGHRQARARPVRRQIDPRRAAGLVPKIGAIGRPVVHLDAPIPRARRVEDARGDRLAVLVGHAAPRPRHPAGEIRIALPQPQPPLAPGRFHGPPRLEREHLARIAQIDRPRRCARRGAAARIARLRHVQGHGRRRHGGRIIRVVLGIEREVVGRPRRQARHFQARASLAAGNDGLVAERVVRAVARSLRRSARRRRRRPRDQHVLAAPLRPAQIHPRGRIARGVLHCRARRRRRQRVDREIVHRSQRQVVVGPVVHRIVGAAARDESPGIVPVPRGRELMLVRLRNPNPIVVVVHARPIRRAPRPARTVRAPPHAVFHRPAGRVRVDAKFKLVRQPIAKIVGVHWRAPVVERRPVRRASRRRRRAAGRGAKRRFRSIPVLGLDLEEIHRRSR